MARLAGGCRDLKEIVVSRSDHTAAEQ